MSAQPGREFPTDGADQWRGFNDAGIEHFRGSPFASLARETLQNSLDAAAGHPVTVSFKYRDITIQEIPNVEQLKGVIWSVPAMQRRREKSEGIFCCRSKIAERQNRTVTFNH